MHCLAHCPHLPSPDNRGAVCSRCSLRTKHLRIIGRAVLGNAEGARSTREGVKLALLAFFYSYSSALYVGYSRSHLCISQFQVRSSPPRATPGHLTPVQFHIVGHLTRIEARPIGHLTRRKNAGHRSRIKRILCSMSQVITPRGFRQHICWYIWSPAY